MMMHLLCIADPALLPLLLLLGQAPRVEAGAQHRVVRGGHGCRSGHQTLVRSPVAVRRIRHLHWREGPGERERAWSFGSPFPATTSGIRYGEPYR
jgi:hypothetical protein